jgi:hypothetical protein
MGKYLDRFRKIGHTSKNVGFNAGRKINDIANSRINNPSQGFRQGKIRDRTINPNTGLNNFDEFNDDFLDEDLNDLEKRNSYFNDDVHVQTPQKPESFHHFILQNKYQDLEKNIRGYKDVFNKEKQEWEVKRKEIHCFTDEESEEILRTVQSHLATDIKLTFYSKETFGLRFLAIYNEIEFIFKRIMEYRYGRYGDSKTQGIMKEQAVKIFVDVITRIEANYLMAIQGMENKRTHEGIQSQESLQGNGDGDLSNRRYS